LGLHLRTELDFRPYRKCSYYIMGLIFISTTKQRTDTESTFTRKGFSKHLEFLLRWRVERTNLQSFQMQQHCPWSLGILFPPKYFFTVLHDNANHSLVVLIQFLWLIIICFQFYPLYHWKISLISAIFSNCTCMPLNLRFYDPFHLFEFGNISFFCRIYIIIINLFNMFFSFLVRIYPSI
jgi:hypothetical protein